MAEATRSTPIQNLQNPTLNQNNGPNISTAEGVLQKYRELENDIPMPARGDQPSVYIPPQGGQPRQPDDVDADTERAQFNQQMQSRQMDPTLAQQHRRMEMERAQHAQQMHQQPPPPMQQLSSPGLMDRVRNLFGNFRNNVKSLVVVVVIFLLLNIDPLNAILLRFIPFLGDGLGNMAFKGTLFKALLAGVLYIIINNVLPF